MMTLAEIKAAKADYMAEPGATEAGFADLLRAFNLVNAGAQGTSRQKMAKKAETARMIPVPDEDGLKALCVGETEPSDGQGKAAGDFFLQAGRYSVRLRVIRDAAGKGWLDAGRLAEDIHSRKAELESLLSTVENLTEYVKGHLEAVGQ